MPWLGATCGVCAYCRSGRENLCDTPRFTGYTRDGGYATPYAGRAPAFAASSTIGDDAAETAPLLCAGLIGWRSYRMAGEGKRTRTLRFRRRRSHSGPGRRLAGTDVYAFTRPGDTAAQAFARSARRRLGGRLGRGATASRWMLRSFLRRSGALVPAALAAVKKGGRVVCGGIHMSDIPGFPYRLLWEERQLVSVANLTRRDAREFLEIAPRAGIRMQVTRYPLDAANTALSDLRAGRFEGAAVLIP